MNSPKVIKSSTLRPCTKFNIHLLTKNVIFSFKIADQIFPFQESCIVGIIELFSLDLDTFEKFSSTIIEEMSKVFFCQKFEFWHTKNNCCTRIAEIYTADALNQFTKDQ